MKRRGRLMMVIATAMTTVSIIAPLLAGVCFNCPNIGQCEGGCTAIKTESKHSTCDTCRHTNENNCPPGLLLLHSMRLETPRLQERSKLLNPVFLAALHFRS